MPVSLVAHAKASINGVSVTPAIDTTGANLLIGYVSTDGVNAPISDSNGNTWIALADHGASYPQSAGLYYCYLPASVGPGHTFSIDASYNSLFVAAFRGVKQSSAFNADTGFSEPGTVTSIQPGSISVLAGDLLVTGVAMFSPSAILTIDSGFSITDQAPGTQSANYGGGLAYLVAAGPGSVDPTWTISDPATNGMGSSLAGFFAAAPAQQQPIGTII